MSQNCGGTAAQHVTVVGRDPISGERLDLTMTNGRIHELHRSNDTSAELGLLAAGFVDAQVNGYAGHDVNGPDVTTQGVVEITQALALIGVTTWVPTVITATEAEIRHSLEVIEEARQTDPVVRDAIPCVHVEGPFISPQAGARGVHDVEQIRPVDPEEVARWCTTGAAPVGVLTISPHDDHAIAAIPALRALGVAVAIGHTHASADQVRAAADAGATLSTHLGNGIPAQVPRHPNAIWAQLAESRLTCGMIADGHHLPSDTLEVMLRAKGPNRAFLVSDATTLAGMAPGDYTTPVGGEVRLEPDGRLWAPDSGYLAGAALDVAAGLRNIVRTTALSLAQALPYVTRNPARVLRGTRPGLGTLVVGAPADVVVLEPDGAVRTVYRGGIEVTS